nr:KrmH [uncultured bacterium]
MRRYIEEIAADEIIAADICIIGSGPAAFALALPFIKGVPTGTPLKVVMLESAPNVPPIRQALDGAECDVQSAFYKGDQAGVLLYEKRSGSIVSRSVGYLGTAWPSGEPAFPGRVRAYGGGTHHYHWGGWSWPLEEHDLGGRAFHDGVAWPIPFAELKHWYDQVLTGVVRLNNTEFDNPDYWVRTYPDMGLAVMPLSEASPLRTRILQFAPFDYAAQYGREIFASDHTDIFYGANAAEFDQVSDGDRKRISRLKVQALNADCTPGRRWYVEANTYVICAGGLESTRLLLLAGLGDQGSKLGRTFMDHPYMGRMVKFNTTDAVPSGVRKFYMSPDQLLGGPPNHSNFIAGLVPSYKWLNENPKLGDFRILLGSEGFGPSPRTVGINTEPQPDHDSRITLTDELGTDPFGQPLMRVDWRTRTIDGDNADTQTLRATIDTLRAVLVDELKYATNFEVIDPAYAETEWTAWRDRSDGSVVGPGLHPMGSTRMSREPGAGVVDQNLRVHNTTNLYVSASSVFPTAGYQNPTNTVCALSARLAQHLIDTSES